VSLSPASPINYHRSVLVVIEGIAWSLNVPMVERKLSLESELEGGIAIRSSDSNLGRDSSWKKL